MCPPVGREQGSVDLGRTDWDSLLGEMKRLVDLDPYAPEAIAKAAYVAERAPRGPATGQSVGGYTFYSRADALRDGLPLIFQDWRGRLRVTYAA